LLAELERVFEREAALLYHVRHEGVVPLLGASVDRDAPDGPPAELALVMPLMARSLEAADTVPAAGPAELSARLGWLQQVARAMRFLHASGIVHGDLKPANVLLDASGARALVCDFGHARLRDAGPDTASFSLGGAAGTPRYRDPAVSSGRSLLRKASDVYSFGILAWHVLAGRVPFEGMDVSAVLAHTAAGGRPDPDALPAGVPGPLRVLLSRCWWENQNDRPTAAALVERLDAAECRIVVGG
jgi:serine/threonine protein kinase